jgi:mannosyltransferase
VPVRASVNRVRQAWWPPSPWALAVFGFTLIGLALRLPSFSDSFWGDELSTNYVVNGFGVGSVLHIVLSDQEGTPPLFYMLAWLTKGFDGNEGLRLVSLLAGLGAIPVTYLLGARTVGRAPGLVGAALVALSPFQIFYATEARAYESVMFFCLLAALFVVIATDTDRLGWWIAYGLAVAAAAYTHYTSIFVLIVIAGWALLAHPQSRLRVIAANLGAALLYIPWIPELLDDRHEPASRAIAQLHPLTLSNAKDDLVHWSIGHPYIPISAVPGHAAVWLMAAAGLVGLIGLMVRGRAGPDASWWPLPGGLWLIGLVALAAPVGAALQAAVGPSVFSTRNIISSWPALALLAGVLVAGGSRPWRFAASALLLAAFVIGGIKMLSADHQRPDYHGVVSYVEASGPANSPVVDSLGLTPGAQTAAEAAFAPKGQAYPRGRKVLTLDFPTLEERLRVRMRGESIIAPEPKPSAQQLAAEAARAAGPNGTIFLLTGGAPLEQLRLLSGPLADFLNDLPPSFHPTTYRDFPGLAYSGIRVIVLRATAQPGPAPLKPRS